MCLNVKNLAMYHTLLIETECCKYYWFESNFESMFDQCGLSLNETIYINSLNSAKWLTHIIHSITKTWRVIINKELNLKTYRGINHPFLQIRMNSQNVNSGSPISQYHILI